MEFAWNSFTVSLGWPLPKWFQARGKVCVSGKAGEKCGGRGSWGEVWGAGKAGEKFFKLEGLQGGLSWSHNIKYCFSEKHCIHSEFAAHTR